MKPILLLCLIGLALVGCQQKDVSPNTYIKPLHLSVEPGPNGISLSWAPAFIFEEGMYPGPTPVDPAQYEIYVSESYNGMLQKVATIDGSVRNYVLSNQPEGKTLYGQVKAIHPKLAGNESSVVTTNIGQLGVTDLLFATNTPPITFGSWGGSTLLYSGWGDMWTIQSANGTVRTLKKESGSPVLSPDGRFIAYLASGNNNTSYATQLFIKNVESGDTRLLETKQAIYTAEWSNDGQSIAFLANNPGSSTGVWLRKIRESTSTQLYLPPVGPNQLQTEQIDWSPDGSSVLVLQDITLKGKVGTDLLSIPISGGSSQSILTSDWQERQPAYSPDGTQLAFISPRSGYRAIWLLNRQTGKLRQLTGVGESFYYINRLDWKSNSQLTYTGRVPSNTDASLKIVTLPN